MDEPFSAALLRPRLIQVPLDEAARGVRRIPLSRTAESVVTNQIAVGYTALSPRSTVLLRSQSSVRDRIWVHFGVWKPQIRLVIEREQDPAFDERP
jgi:hypothetical protein